MTERDLLRARLEQLQQMQADYHRTAQLELAKYAAAITEVSTLIERFEALQQPDISSDKVGP